MGISAILPSGRVVTARSVAAIASICVLAATPLVAQERSARFIMSPVDGGFARLDTETGAMSVCRAPSKEAPASSWACSPMSDSNTAQDAQRRKLEDENKELRAEIRRMEDQLGLNGDKPQAESRRAERPGGGFTLPSEQEVDKALSYVERMVKKFHETMKRLEGKSDEGRKGIAL